MLKDTTFSLGILVGDQQESSIDYFFEAVSFIFSSVENQKI